MFANRTRGLTLVELMVAIAIASILVVFGIPAFDAVISNNRLASERDALFAHLRLARAEAVNRNRSVVVCASPDGLACVNGNNWSIGWVVFVEDDDAGEQQDPTADDAIVLAFQDAPTNLTANLALGAGADLFVRYSPTGRANTAGMATFSFCDDDFPQFSRAVLVSPTTGQTRTGDENDANCG